MAKFLWERCDEAIPSAIIASKIYLTLSEMIANYDSDAKAMYLKNKEWVAVSFVLLLLKSYWYMFQIKEKKRWEN